MTLPLPQPFECTADELVANLDAHVDAVYARLESTSLILPKGTAFVECVRFSEAYEVLKRETAAFADFSPPTIWAALHLDSMVLLVLRTILGLTPPEWAALTREETLMQIDQGFARTLDRRVRVRKDYIAKLHDGTTRQRLNGMIEVACKYVSLGAPVVEVGALHRLDKADTTQGPQSLQRMAQLNVPYAMLLYERLLGRPFASHRDSVSELVGDVMENAVETLLADAGISYRKTKRAERLPGFDQAPDFMVPDEWDTKVAIEAKITNDDGTARDKFTRLIHLTEISQDRHSMGQPGFQVIACIDGRGFGIRREDMRRLLRAVEGKVFTLQTLNQLIMHTALSGYRTKGRQQAAETLK